MEGLEILARKIMLYIYINTLVIGFMGTANAVAFSDLVDWDHQIRKGRTASMVFNKNGPIELIHDDIILGEGISITEPVLTISHRGNVATKKIKEKSGFYPIVVRFVLENLQSPNAVG